MLNKVYLPSQIEKHWYKIWEDNKYFSATLDKKHNYSIVMPPPNVTGILHMGHVLNNSIQDTLIRYKRMNGMNVLWMPGTDHAGIATQNKVERKLADNNLTKEMIGREEFLKETWKWKEKHGDIITNQLRKLGSSLDWDRERFTMDEGCSQAVAKMFTKLYQDDLIYKGEYVVNWCSRCGTALADDEVEHEEKKGKMYYLKYMIPGTKEWVEVATTRTETLGSDKAVVVHPDDHRYKHLVGKTVISPLRKEEIPVITDEYIDMDFGSGVMKCSAHAATDIDILKKHNLPIEECINKDGKLNKYALEFEGLSRSEARIKIAEKMKEENLLIKEEDHIHQVGVCYRCNTDIESQISEQWFVKMKILAERALDVVKNGEITITPKRWEKVYYNWLENIRDWCISRQIWWGHRIPAYYGPDKKIFVAENKMEAYRQAKLHYGKEVELHQEKDVLDTWFSSALWPFSTLGWPNDSKALEMFYPTSILVTGADILFFWVARMVMLGLYEMDTIPFKDVYLHGIVRDENGKKMSKTLGNSPDPLELIEKYGADAIRFTMLYNTSQGQDIHFSEKLIEMGRNFSNKIWNVSRFVLLNLGDFDYNNVTTENLKLELSDIWIMSKLDKTIQKARKQLDNLLLDEAAKSIYEFIKGNFCDWYVEVSKIRLNNKNSKQERETVQYILWNVLEKSLRLLHPFMPFITEEIWQKLKVNSPTIMLTNYPENEGNILEDKEEEFAFLQNVVTGVRNLRAEQGISPAKEVSVFIKSEKEILNILIENKDFLGKILNINNLILSANPTLPEQYSIKIYGELEIYLSLEGLIDKDKEKEKIENQIIKINNDKKKIEAKLSNKEFMSKAPQKIIEREERIKSEYEVELEKLYRNMESLK